MNVTYDVVPNIISCKDLDYLSDMFNWHYGAYKTNYNAINSINDNEIKSTIEKAVNIFHKNMNEVLNIIKNGGNNE